jgi:hypothetical protein
MITPEAFVLKVIMQDYEGVKEAFREGFDVNTRIPGRVPLVEAAQPAEDYEMLYILWKAGAVPTTPWLQDVFACFEKGIMPKKEKKELPQKIKKFSQNSFSISKLKIFNGSLLIQDGEWKIVLPIEPFELDGEIIETAIYLESISIPTDSLKQLEDRKFQFPEYPEDGYIDSSVYLKNVHNPITVKTITFKKHNARKNTIHAELEMEFNFEVIDLKNEFCILKTLLSL